MMHLIKFTYLRRDTLFMLTAADDHVIYVNNLQLSLIFN